MSLLGGQQLPVPANKSAIASPRQTAADVELSPVQNGTVRPSIPLEEDIMQCARLGALEHIQKMVENGKVSAKYQDPEGITPLHWAAINNQYAVCKYLLDQGVDVNAKGGESGATPCQWAAQRCHFYIVHLLLQRGADPMAVDGQGYNILHLAAIDGNALLLMLLLHQSIPVDAADPQGHTALMWACYKGWPACVDLLLRWGASANAADEAGFTPLHWALVKGSKPCIERLLEYGADRSAKTNEGKTPAMCASEMNTTKQYHRALADQGYRPDGTSITLPLGLSTFVRDKSKMSKFFFFWPFAILFTVLYVVSHFSIYIGIPLAFVTGFGMQMIAQQLGNRSLPELRVIHKTPYLAGVFAATLFWVGIDYISAVLPITWSSNPFSNLVFIFAFSSTTYFYFLAMTEDPGYVPKLSSRNQQKAVVEELFSLWKFDEENFCLQCMVRKPLRSKHCRRCARCVAKHDHHCPWINSCVGNNNIRHFFIYILSMEVGIILFTRLVLAYLEALPEPKDPICNVLSPVLCSFALRDPWTIALTIWALIQLVWVTMLIVVQSVQISKNQTTFENMKRHSHHDHALPLHRPPVTQGVPTATTSLNDTAAASTRIHSHPRKPDGCLGRWKKLLGLDAFLVTASDASQGKIQVRGNPFSRGVFRNCKDFWCDPAPLFGQRNNGEGYLGGEIVDYARMYEVPSRTRGGRARDGMVYSSVAGDDNDGDDEV